MFKRDYWITYLNFIGFILYHGIEALWSDCGYSLLVVINYGLCILELNKIGLVKHSGSSMEAH